ncbi:hypothetical protein V8J36_20640 [Frigidibacter sp. MR17.14]|uniref:hypothetical protein n=1 Tax=Frigidibacter sp. MR17.14 TaxID=3126509 RepID=UPI003012E8B8
MKHLASVNFLPDPAKSRAKRPIPKASQGHFVGEFVFGFDKPQRVGFASLLEYNAALCAVYRPGFVDLEEQLERVVFRKLNGKPGDHYLDYRVTYHNGLRIGMAVKPAAIAAKPEFQATMRAVARAAVSRVVDKVVVVTERHIHPVELHNAELFHAARRPVADEDRVIGELCARLRTPNTVEAMLDQGRHDGVTLFGVARAIHGRGLRLVRNERIDHSALVAANDVRQAA